MPFSCLFPASTRDNSVQAQARQKRRELIEKTRKTGVYGGSANRCKTLQNRPSQGSGPGGQQQCLPSQRGFCNTRLVRSRGLEPPHPYGYMHLKHARLPIPPRPQISKLVPTSSHSYLKLVSGALGWLSVAQTIESGRGTGPWRSLSAPRIRSK